MIYKIELIKKKYMYLSTISPMVIPLKSATRPPLARIAVLNHSTRLINSFLPTPYEYYDIIQNY